MAVSGRGYMGTVPSVPSGGQRGLSPIERNDDVRDRRMTCVCSQVRLVPLHHCCITARHPDRPACPTARASRTRGSSSGCSSTIGETIGDSPLCPRRGTEGTVPISPISPASPRLVVRGRCTGSTHRGGGRMSRRGVMVATSVCALAGCSSNHSTAPSGQLLLQQVTVGGTDSRSVQMSLAFARSREGDSLEGVCFPLAVEVEREESGRWTRVPTTYLGAGSQCFPVFLPDPVTRLGTASGRLGDRAVLRPGERVRVTLVVGGHRFTSTTRDVSEAP